MDGTHYPAPWSFEEEPNGQDFVSIHHEGALICTVRGTDDMSCIEEDEVEEARLQCISNARLIKEAPYMLNALRHAVEVCEGIDYLDELVSEMEQVINRATLAERA